MTALSEAVDRLKAAALDDDKRAKIFPQLFLRVARSSATACHQRQDWDGAKKWASHSRTAKDGDLSKIPAEDLATVKRIFEQNYLAKILPPDGLLAIQAIPNLPKVIQELEIGLENAPHHHHKTGEPLTVLIKSEQLDLLLASLPNPLPA